MASERIEILKAVVSIGGVPVMVAEPPIVWLDVGAVDPAILDDAIRDVAAGCEEAKLRLEEVPSE